MKELQVYNTLLNSFSIELHCLFCTIQAIGMTVWNRSKEIRKSMAFHSQFSPTKIFTAGRWMTLWSKWGERTIAPFVECFEGRLSTGEPSFSNVMWLPPDTTQMMWQRQFSWTSCEVISHDCKDALLTLRYYICSIITYHYKSNSSTFLQGSEGSLPRVKPFKYAYEKEIVLYAYFKKLDYFATECVYAPDAYRGHARALVKDLEALRSTSIIDIIHAGIL